jgi:antitoxin VapB
MLIHAYMLGGLMRITVHIPDKLGPIVKRAAESQGLSISALTAKALELYVKENRRRKTGNCLLNLVKPGSVPEEAWAELEKGRVDDRA